MQDAAENTGTGDLLTVDRLSVAIGGVKLLADVSFSVKRGEVVGLVGESGSGKTLSGMSVMRLLPADATIDGSVVFDGVDLLTTTDEQMRALRGRRLSMIFQEPRASLHPSRAIGKQLVDVALAHHDISRAEAEHRAGDLLERVGLSQPHRIMASHTRELSGGMCQRIMIAMALIGDPSLMIADEPTTALDVTIQAQIMELLSELAEERDLAVMLISHNLGVVSNLCSRVVTMYCGQVVNVDSTRQLLTAPQHPYPWGLLQASRIAVGDGVNGSEIAGPPANPAKPPEGCRFHPRCPHRIDACLAGVPELTMARSGGVSRCVRHEELELEGVLA